MALFYTIQTLIWFRYCNNPYQDFINTKKCLQAQSSQTAQSPPQKLGMEDVLDDLNAKILDQYRKYLGKDKIFVDEYSTLDIDKEIDQMNPTLWKAIYMLTRSASERRGWDS